MIEPLIYSHHETLRGGSAWSRRMRAHEVLRIVDTSGAGCVSALFYNAHELLERYNMADTMKAQFTAFLTKGRVLYSDMGRVLCSIVEDTVGWHDTLGGASDAASSHAQFGEGNYQVLRNQFHRNARDNFIVELSKHGLGKRDIVANVNFFTKVVADREGAVAWAPRTHAPGSYVDLRFEMDTLVVLSNTPHPLDPAKTYAPPEVTLARRIGSPAPADDLCRKSRSENGRGFALTEAYLNEGSAKAASVAGSAAP